MSKEKEFLSFARNILSIYEKQLSNSVLKYD